VAIPPRETTGDRKLLLLAIFIVLSARLSTMIARLFAEPLNRRNRQLQSFLELRFPFDIVPLSLANVRVGSI
jgi:hypothetical protein